MSHFFFLRFNIRIFEKRIADRKEEIAHSQNIKKKRGEIGFISKVLNYIFINCINEKQACIFSFSVFRTVRSMESFTDAQEKKMFPT